MITTLSLPIGVKHLLKVGQKVDFNTPFLEDETKYDVTVAISKKLHIPSDKIFKYLKKFVGDSVAVDEPLAERKGLIGNYTVLSEYVGVIKEVNHNEGTVVVTTSKSQGNYRKAYFKGSVIDLTKDQIKIKVVEGREFMLSKATKNFGGEVIYLKDSTKPISAPQALNKIMVIESIDVYLKTKAEALGINGFITVKQPPQNTDLPHAQVSSTDDFKKILHLNYPYCLIDKQYSKIYFYK